MLRVFLRTVFGWQRRRAAGPPLLPLLLTLARGRAAGAGGAPSGPPLADEGGHARAGGHEAGTGTHASGQLGTLG